MPYTNEELVELNARLCTAIDQNNFALVQEILTDRDPNGVPYADINRSRDDINLPAALYALQNHHHEINPAIVEELLYANTGGDEPWPITHLNTEKHFGDILTRVIDHLLMTSDVKLRLIGIIINLRNPTQDLVYDIQKSNRFAPLIHAVAQGEIDIVRELLEVRNNDGSYAFDVNLSIKNIRGEDMTALDETTKDYPQREKFQHNKQAIRSCLISAGALHGSELKNQEAIDRSRAIRPFRSRVTIARPIIRPITQPVLAQVAPVVQPVPAGPVNQSRESSEVDTHDRIVTHAVKCSLLALNQRYGDNVSESESLVLVNIAQLLNNFDYSTLIIDKVRNVNFREAPNRDALKKTYALEFLGLMAKSEVLKYVHTHTGFGIRRIYALIWEAVIDDDLNAVPEVHRGNEAESLTRAKRSYVEHKKSCLIERFIQANLEYRARSVNDHEVIMRREFGLSNDICSGGLINKLVESLNKAHIDVDIDVGDINSVANKIPRVTLTRLVKLLPVKEQRRILSDWYSDSESSHAAEFRRVSKRQIRADIIDQLGSLVSERLRNEIVEATQDVEIPYPHIGLYRIINEITKIEYDVVDTNKNVALIRLKEMVEHAYDECDRTLDEEYQLLFHNLTNFKNGEYAYTVIILPNNRGERNIAPTTTVIPDDPDLVDEAPEPTHQVPTARYYCKFFTRNAAMMAVTALAAGAAITATVVAVKKS